MKNWQTTISGSFAALGTFLLGGPIALSAFNIQLPDKLFAWLVTIGFIMNGLAVFLGHLFAADKKAVNDLKVRVDETTAAIKTGDTSIINKRDLPEPPKP